MQGGPRMVSGRLIRLMYEATPLFMYSCNRHTTIPTSSVLPLHLHCLRGPDRGHAEERTGCPSINTPAQPKIAVSSLSHERIPL